MGIEATEEELEELRKVAVSGIQSVESDGRKVVYRSLDDQQRILDAGTGASGAAKRRRFVDFDKGYR